MPPVRSGPRASCSTPIARVWPRWTPQCKGANVFERSEVLRIRARAKAVEVETEGGTVSAATVVIAGGAAIPDLRPLRRHLRTRHGYAVVTAPLSAPVKRELGPRSAVLRLGNDPPQFVRWLPGDRVMVEGADQDPVPARAREQAVIQRSGQLMYELSLMFPAISGTPAEWGWVAPFDDTVDVCHTSAATGISRATCSPSVSAAWRRRIVAGRADAPAAVCRHPGEGGRSVQLFENSAAA